MGINQKNMLVMIAHEQFLCHNALQKLKIIREMLLKFRYYLSAIYENDKSSSKAIILIAIEILYHYCFKDEK